MTTSNKNLIAELGAIIERNDLSEIRSFRNNNSNKPYYLYVDAACHLIDAYIENNDFDKVTRALELRIVTGEAYAIIAIDDHNVPLFNVFLPYVPNLASIMEWAVHSKNSIIIDLLLNGNQKTHNADKPLFYFALRHIVRNFTLEKIQHYIGQLDTSKMKDKMSGLIVDLVSNTTLTNSQVTEAIEYLIHKGANVEVNLKHSTHRAFTEGNLALIKYLARYNKYILNDAFNKDALKEAIVKKSTPLKFLKSLTSDDEIFITISLNLYFLTTKKSPIKYLSSCPKWQQIHVVAHMQKNM
jgi:hypothetical protein